MMNLLLLLVVGLALILQLANVSAGTTISRTFYPAAANYQTDLMFDYTGRWQFSSYSSSSSPPLLKKKHHDDEGIVRADWPCSGVQFRIQTTTSTTSTSTTSIRTKSVNHQDNDNKNAVLTLRLGLNRVRARVVITNDATGKVESSTILEGKSFWDSVRDYDVPLPLHSSSSNDNDQSFTVSLTKLTQPSPYMMGVGHSLTSILHFHGVSVSSAADFRLVPFQQQQSRRRRVQVIGASDTAGYCVDGTPDTADAKVLPWKYDNCDATSHAVLGRRFAADMSIQAIPGIGLTQNAFADKPYLLGKPTMPDYYPRVLQTDERDVWKFAEQPTPDLVVVSLGGNDFNHQLQVPSSKDFESAYHALLHQIAEPYLNKNDEELNVVPTIVSICGQGDPTEHARDPNNDRCRPCPAVQQAVESFASNPQNSRIKVDYVFIPCDGTVVTGTDDIGCEGHKNRLGQLRVANYLEPRLRDIMKWHDDESDITTTTNTVAAKISKNRDPLFDFEGEIVVQPASSPRSRRSKIIWGLSLLTIVVLVGRRLTDCCRSSCCCCRGGATTTEGPQYRRSSSSSSSTSGSAMRKRYYYNRQRCSTASLSLSLEDDDFDDDIEDDIDDFGRELQQQQACFDRSEEYYSTASSSDDSDSDDEDNQPQQRIVVV